MDTRDAVMLRGPSIGRLAIAVVLVLALCGSSGCAPEATPESPAVVPESAELVEEPGRYDGQAVVFEGEAVGEAMARGRMAWLHLNDDAYYRARVDEGVPGEGYNTGMPVWVERGLTEEIRYYGDHAHQGDIVEVAGVYNAACAEHGGDTDIHASSLRVTRVGGPVAETVDPVKARWAMVLGLLVLGLFSLDRWRFRIWEHRGS